MGNASEFIGLIMLSVVPALIGLVIVGVARGYASQTPKPRVVEFVPPSEGGLFQHALAMRADRRMLAAALVDLTIRRGLRLLTPPGAASPIAAAVNPAFRLSSDETAFLDALRAPRKTPRQQRRYAKALQGLGIVAADPNDVPDVVFLKGRGVSRRHRRRQLRAFRQAMQSSMSARGFARRGPIMIHLVLLSLLFIATVVGALILGLGAIVNGAWAGLVAVVLGIVAMFAVLLLAPPQLLRFTDNGNAMREHLARLREYIRLGEQQRIQYLQSPQGALRTHAGALTPGGVALGLTPAPAGADPVAQSGLDRFVLIERLLPYAVIFKQEKGWQREFAQVAHNVELDDNLEVLGHTFEALMIVADAASAGFQIVRGVSGIFAFFANT